MSFLDQAKKAKKCTTRKAKKRITRKAKGGLGSGKLKYLPHKYQKKAIKFGVELGAAGFFLDPGLGKTSIILAIIKILLKLNLITKVLVIAPLRVCYSVWPEEVKKWADFEHLRVSVVHGSPKKRKEALDADADIYVINPEGMDWLSKQKDWFFDMLVVDECFPGETLVTTAEGQKRIDTITLKDKILSSDGNFYKPKKILKRTANKLVQIKLTSGVCIRCTEAHPIFTNKGWVLAKNLKSGDCLYDNASLQKLRQKFQCEGAEYLLQQTLFSEWQNQILHSMRQRIFSSRRKNKMLLSKMRIFFRWERKQRKISTEAHLLQTLWGRIQTKKLKTDLLFFKLCSKMETFTTWVHRKNIYKRNTLKDIKSAYGEKTKLRCMEQGHPNVSINEEKTQQKIKTNWAQTKDTGWKWSWFNQTTKFIVKGSWRPLVGRVCNIIRRTYSWIPHLLQSRFGTHFQKIGNRSRRAFTSKSCRTRQKERYQTKRIRVESIKVVELGGGEIVYNLELKGTPHYFAENVLVHNCSKYKNTNTARFKLMRKLINKFPRRYILTGTPTPNGLMNLFGQIYLLDQGASLGRYITHYRNEFFYQTGYGGYEYKLQEGADKRIYDKIKPLVLRMDAEDYLELPPLVVNNIKVTLPDNVKKIYNDMEDHLISQIESGEVVAANAAVASQKCRQIANGGLYLDQGGSIDQFLGFLKDHGAEGLILGSKKYKKQNERAYEELHLAKAEAVADLVEELEGQPALIAYEFHHDLDRLKKVLGKNTPHIGSGISPKRSQEIITAWNKGEIPVLLGQPSSMSHGLNMQGAGRAVIFHSLIWDLEAYDQFIKRVWRQGQKNTVFVYHIVSDTSIDYAVLHALKSKHKTQKALLDALKNYEP